MKKRKEKKEKKKKKKKKKSGEKREREKSQFLLTRSTQYHTPEKGTCTHAPGRKL